MYGSPQAIGPSAHARRRLLTARQALAALRLEASAERACRPSGAHWAALAPAAPPRGVLELTAAHLAELSVLRLFGADRVALELERLAVHCEASEDNSAGSGSIAKE